MNECDPKLLEALRAMAVDGPREAPASVEERLVSAFRRRSRLRRRVFPLAIAAASIAAGIATMAWLRPAPSNPVVARVSPPVTKVEIPVPKPAVVVEPKRRSVRLTHRRGPEVALNFYRLPGADELPPMESATVVRVQLPMSSLRLIGLPVNEDRAAESIQADMLVGQDGLPRGVRFVQ